MHSAAVHGDQLRSIAVRTKVMLRSVTGHQLMSLCLHRKVLQSGKAAQQVILDGLLCGPNGYRN